MDRQNYLLSSNTTRDNFNIILCLYSYFCNATMYNSEVK